MTHDKTDLDQSLTLGNLFFKWNGDFLRLPDHIEYILYNTYNNNHQKTQKKHNHLHITNVYKTHVWWY